MRWVAGVCALAFLSAGCGAVGPEDPRLEELEAHLARWDSTGPMSYVYAIERLCFCPEEYRGPVRVSVQDGEAVEHVYVGSGLPVPEAIADGVPPVEGLFAILRAAIESEADRIDVVYDAELGVPLDFWIDYLEMAADEELGVQVTEAVTPLP
jgi:hypothetical protein